MLKFVQGDILQAGTEAIVNTVNCVGVMGRGIALQFKKAWPENFKAYERACKAKEVVPGKMFIYRTDQLTNPKYIINFPTKRHWRMRSRIEDIDVGLEAFVRDVKMLGVRSVAIPPLGAGLGGLDWNLIRAKIQKAVETLPEVDVLVYEPNAAPETDVMVKTAVVPAMTAGRAVLVELMHRYLEGWLDPAISLLEVHKLTYFMQEAGEPLRLQFDKAAYGPYAVNLRHVLNLIEGHFISGYRDGGDDPAKELRLVSGVEKQAKAVLESSPDTLQRLERVSSLIDGFESSTGLELLATAHWLSCHEKNDSLEKIKQGFRSWNSHKRQFTSRQIEIAVQRLQDQHWL